MEGVDDPIVVVAMRRLGLEPNVLACKEYIKFRCKKAHNNQLIYQGQLHADMEQRIEKEIAKIKNIGITQAEHDAIGNVAINAKIISHRPQPP